MPSSVIRNFRYLTDDKTLEITFVSGKRYHYLEVPEELYRQMRAVTSRGEFFNQHIRDHFEFERVEGITPAS